MRRPAPAWPSRLLATAFAALVLALVLGSDVPAIARTTPAVIAPAQGAQVDAAVRLGVRAGRGLRRVSFRIDGTLVRVDRKRPFRLTRTLPPGAHRVTIRWARRLHGRTRAGSVTRRFTVLATRPTAPGGSAAQPGQSTTQSGSGSGTGSTTTTTPGLPGWRLVDSDEFNADGAPDAAKWSVYDAAGHGGLGLRRPSAIAQSGGVLNITAAMRNGTLVSGGMAARRNFTYGRVELRVRLDTDPTNVMRGVALTWPQSENWPVDGENDIFETEAGNSGQFFSFVHSGAGDTIARVAHAASPTAWHTVVMEWSASAIRFSIDGVPGGSVTSGAAIPDVAHHVCLQLDPTQATMSGTARLQVDYVRVYAPA